MSSLSKIVLTSLVIFVSMGVNIHAQNEYKGEFSKHSIEISTGIPNLITLATAPYGHDTFPDLEKDYGWKYEHLMRYNLNIAYVNEISRRWDFLAILDLGLGHYTRYNYREWIEDDETDSVSWEGGHWEGGPDKAGVKFLMGDVNLTAAFRYKWAYTEHCKFYSALGVGVSAALSPVVPLPYITPIGISVGQNKRIYSFAEATLGTTGTFFQGGIGVRLGKK
ncbi:MAG: hypothetical protein MJZ16_06955 [Bacteroidales bacterium]|nr:hypothetical protein [Bacteroidales bacterium]